MQYDRSIACKPVVLFEGEKTGSNCLLPVEKAGLYEKMPATLSFIAEQLRTIKRNNGHKVVVVGGVRFSRCAET